jgi:hypothetical protein
MIATEGWYSAFDCELLTAYTTVQHFLLVGQRFRLLMEHKPLVSVLSHVSSPWSACQQGQLAFLSEFTSNIRQTPGHAHVVADALLQPPPASQ